MQYSFLNIIEFCKNTFNLKIVAIVCDQLATNILAYNKLGVFIDKPSFKYKEGNIVYAFHDYTHLLNGIISLLIEKNITFTYNEKKVVASISETYSDEKKKQ